MKLFKLCLAALMALALFGCEAKVDKSNYKYLDDIRAVTVDMAAYKNFKDTDHVFKRITMSESLRFFDEKATGILYYGYSECPYCIQAVPVLNDVAKKYGLTVYYIDIEHTVDTIKKEDIDRYLEIAKDDLMKDQETGEPGFFVPQIFVVINGEIVAAHVGAVDSYNPDKGDMTSAQKSELKKIYETMFKDIK